MNKNLRFLTEAAMIAALYVVLTLLVQPIASGPIQFRVSEALMLVPALTGAAIPGLWLGCVLANILMGFGWIDIVFGGLATLLAAVVTRWLAARFHLLPSPDNALTRKDILSRWGTWILPLPAVVFNALIVGFYLPILMPMEGRSFFVAVLVSMGQLAISEAVVVYLLGITLFVALHPVYRRLNR